MSSSEPIIGVLALQGCVERHKPHIEAAGGIFKPVKTPEQFDAADAFILPGGESTTMLKLIDNFGLWESLERNFKAKPVWGICAGSILLAEKVENPSQKSFGILPITVRRNAYGRQLDSYKTEIEGCEVSFIRAPVFTDIAADVEVLAKNETGPVWIRHGRNMASAFHPELSFDTPSPMHRLFIESLRK
jgi:5'-phosphate synthase pdxT subunit